VEEDVLKRRDRRHAGLGALLVVLGACGGPAGPPQAALLDLAQLQGRLQPPRQRSLLVVFWATWCKPCIEEIPDLVAMHSRHRETLEILAVSLDAFLHPAARSLELVQAQQRQTPTPYENVVFTGSQDELFAAFQLPGGIPFAVLFDAAGREVRRFNGKVRPDELDDALAALAP
jgi:thiol-disulfide isomerase/thioredoxin